MVASAPTFTPYRLTATHPDGPERIICGRLMLPADPRDPWFAPLAEAYIAEHTDYQLAGGVGNQRFQASGGAELRLEKAS